MNTLVSRDGTRIAYDKAGEGQAIILVAGALNFLGSGPSELAKLLAGRFAVYDFDRRGRGKSGDVKPYTVVKEIEDIESLIDRVSLKYHLLIVITRDT
jgi:pimeloyl-ACP methyl ester carboxylesterase